MKSLKKKIFLFMSSLMTITAILLSSISMTIINFTHSGTISQGNALLGILVCHLSLFSIGYLISIKFASSIVKPIKACANRLTSFSQGDFHSETPTTKAKDEVGMLMAALDTSVNALNSIVSDISYHLQEISNGNLTTRVTRSYKGDATPIETSLKRIIIFLNEIMDQIERSAAEVAAGSNQLADSAQCLSQGASEQASSIEEVAATLSEISQHINRNAKNASLANQISTDTANEVLESNEQMQKMIEAMQEIESTSHQIHKIINAIDDIASQTNILALNAAVEAARAGVAGKGFAVVADEVRNLANKSAEAAKNTAQLIESSLNAIENGSKIADQTAKKLTAVVAGAKKSTDLIEQIASASNEQATSIAQITQSIEQISSVIQTNSATSEESAAASEELSGHSEILKSLTFKFKVQNIDNANRYEFNA